MSAAATTRRAPFVLPNDPFVRAELLRARIGTRIALSSGDFFVEGMLVTVVAPVAHSEHPVPVVIIDTGMERLAGPVLEGDRLA